MILDTKENKFTLVKKAYTIPRNMFEGCNELEEIITVVSNSHPSSKAQKIARVQLFSKIHPDNWIFIWSSEPVKYISLPVRRIPQYDMYDFEGELLNKMQIDCRITERIRQKKMDMILLNDSVTHCYIKKHGSYYMSGYAGYTQFLSFAGVYPKIEAIAHGRNVQEITIVPINTEEHNNFILNTLKELVDKFIK